MNDPLLERTRRDGPRRAVVDGGERFWVTWFDLDGLATAWARRLQRLGVRAGQRVGVQEPAGVRLAALLHGCLRAGFAIVPLPTRAPAAEIDRILADARPRALVSGGDAHL